MGVITETTAGVIRDALASATDKVVRVAQTGGGTATMYVGDDSSREGYAWLAIGPGSYNWADPERSTFTLGDQAICIGPDDDGTAPAVYVDTIDQLVDYVRDACVDCGRPWAGHLIADSAPDTRDGLGCAYTDGSRQHEVPA